MLEYKTYTIYINRKAYNVNHLVYLCHLTGEFNRFESLDTYVNFFVNFRFNNKSAVATYIYNYCYSNEDTQECKLTVGMLIGSHLQGFYKLIKEGGLFYCYVYFKHFSYFLNAKNIKEDLYLTSKKINSTAINNNVVANTNYKKLDPYLKFYKELSIRNTDLIISKDIIYEVLSYLNIEVNIEEIKKDLINHCIILPYKDNFIWSSNILLKDIEEMSPFLVNLSCLQILLKNI